MLAAGAHPLPRHGLVRLSPSGWDQVRAGTWCDSATACLTHWASHDLPLVVTRQHAAQAEALICLGLPAPQRWGRQRLALQVEAQQLTQASAFPPAASLQPLLAARQHAPWRVVCAQWAALGVCVRVHGSYGWQWLTGLDHLHAGSDLDLLLTVRSAEQADQVVQVLHDAHWPGPRLDGELIFPDGSAVAWREWPIWRAGCSSQVLVKRRDEALLESGLAWLQRATRMSP